MEKNDRVFHTAYSVAGDAFHKHRESVLAIVDEETIRSALGTTALIVNERAVALGCETSMGSFTSNEKFLQNLAEVSLFEALGLAVPKELASVPTLPSIVLEPWAPLDPTKLPRLDCVYGEHYWRGELVVTIAPGGVGKSSLSIAEALAMLTCKPLLGEVSRKALRVGVLNFEDSQLVVSAAVRHYDLMEYMVTGAASRLFVKAMDGNGFGLT
jgi:hypothetical protein